MEGEPASVRGMEDGATAADGVAEERVSGRLGGASPPGSRVPDRLLWPPPLALLLPPPAASHAGGPLPGTLPTALPLLAQLSLPLTSAVGAAAPWSRGLGLLAPLRVPLHPLPCRLR